jgi:hypothetical protein
MQMTVQGTVVDEAGVAIGGASVTLGGDSSSPPLTAVTDFSGHYELHVVTSNNYFGGHADKTSYETTWRDSYFAASPGVLNFRLFQPLRLAAGDSAHLNVTADGSLCGIDDEWYCRIVRVHADRAGTLEVQATPDNPSIRAVAAIGNVSYDCCPSAASVSVSAGQEVLIYVQLDWDKPTTGVTLRTSMR